MKIKDGFVIRRVGDSFVAVATGKAAESFKGMIKLNDTAALVWEDLQQGLPLDEVVAHLCDEYEVDALRAREDVETLCGDLIDAGIVE
ncbi:MAG: PqqD family protein [Eggerthellaceae bacterium]|nr:PqqD family protein [Eggerthellaceae bacterium]